jgi:hypothetical protein
MTMAMATVPVAAMAPAAMPFVTAMVSAVASTMVLAATATMMLATLMFAAATVMFATTVTLAIAVLPHVDDGRIDWQRIWTDRRGGGRHDYQRRREQCGRKLGNQRHLFSLDK